MRQSRHLGLSRREIVPVNELVGLVALEYLKYVSIGYSQVSRKGFFHYMFAWNNYKPQKIEEIEKSVRNRLSSINPNNITCDCSSYVSAMYYIAHYIGKSRDGFKHSNADPARYNATQLRRHPQRFVTGNPWTSYNMQSITRYNFEKVVGTVELQPGDIIVHHSDQTPGVNSETGETVFEGMKVNRVADGGQEVVDSVGHVQLYIGKGVWNNTEYKDLLIECGGAPGGVIAGNNSISLSHACNNGAWESGGKILYVSQDIKRTQEGTYVLRKVVKRKTQPKQIIIKPIEYNNTYIDENEEEKNNEIIITYNNLINSSLYYIDQDSSSQIWAKTNSLINTLKLKNNKQAQLLFNFEPRIYTTPLLERTEIKDEDDNFVRYSWAQLENNTTIKYNKGTFNTLQINGININNDYNITNFIKTYAYIKNIKINIQGTGLDNCYCCLSNLSFLNLNELNSICLNDTIDGVLLSDKLFALDAVNDTINPLSNPSPDDSTYFDSITEEEIQELNSLIAATKQQTSKYVKQFNKEDDNYTLMYGDDIENTEEFSLLFNTDIDNRDENSTKPYNYYLYFYLKEDENNQSPLEEEIKIEKIEFILNYYTTTEKED